MARKEAPGASQTLQTAKNGAQSSKNALQTILGQLSGFGGVSSFGRGPHSDRAAAIAAASQYVNGGINLDGDGVADDGSYNEDMSSQDSVAHMLNRLLIKGLIVPLTDTDREDYQSMLRGPEKAGINVNQALDTLTATVKSSPKFLEHVFTPRHDDLSSGPSSFRNTTFDVWVAPRMFSASAASAAFLCGKGRDLATIGSLSNLLPLQIIQRLVAVLSASMEVVNQVDNVRLVLMECLRASVQALSRVGHPSFLPDANLPSALVSGCRAEHEKQDAPSITFFAPNQLPDGFRLSSRQDRPKPSGVPIKGMTAEQSRSTFTFKLSPAPVSASQLLITAHALLFGAVELCLELANRFPGQLQDLGDYAARLFASNWEYHMASSKSGGYQLSLSPLLQAWRLEIAHNHIRQLSALYPLTASRLAALVVRAAVEKLESGVEKGTPASDPGASTKYDSLVSQSLLKAVGALQPDSAEGASSDAVGASLIFLLKPHLASFVRQVTEKISSEDIDDIMAEHKESSQGRVLRMLATKRNLALRLLLLSAKFGILVSFTQQEDLRRSAFDRQAWQEQRMDSDQSYLDPEVLQYEWPNQIVLDALLQAIELPQSDVDSTIGKRKCHEADSSSSQGRSRRNVTFADVQVAYRGILEDQHLDSHDLSWFDKLQGPTLLHKLNHDGYRVCAEANNLRERSRDAFMTRYKPQAWACAFCDQDYDSFAPFRIEHVQDRVLREWLLRTNSALSDNKPHASATLKTFRRFLNHCKIEVFHELGLPPLDNLLRLAFRHKQRAVRLAAGKITFDIAFKASELPPTGAGTDKRRELLNFIVGASRRCLDLPNPKLQETAILALSMLARLFDEQLQGDTLLSLVLQLSNPNPMLKALAHTEVVQLAARRRNTTFQLLRPHLEVISTTIVEKFNSMPDLWTGMLNLIKMSQQDFFNATLEFTLPHLITMICQGKAAEGKKMIELIARALGLNMAKMCLAHITAIFKYFLIRGKDFRDRAFQVLLDLIAINSTNLKSLLRSRQHEVVGHLVIKLGNDKARAGAWNGLDFIDETLNDSAAAQARRQRSSVKTRIANFLKDEILAILAWINAELVGEHGRRTVWEKAQAARSIGALVSIIGPPIHVVTPQITATLNSTLQEHHVTEATLESWKIFITTLRFDDIGPFIGQTAAALLSAWPIFNKHAKATATDILSYLIIDNAADLSAYIKDIPSLDSLEPEIAPISRKLRSLREAWNADHRFKNILERASHENLAICLHSLGELSRFLEEEREYIEGLVSGDAFSPLIGDCVRMLFAVVARSDSMRDDDMQTELRSLCFECLGAIGAVDPDRFDHHVDEPIRTLLHNFENQDEAADFSVHLIRDLLVPAFRATDDTNHQSALAYAIQELLKFCGFTSALLAPGNNARPVLVKVKQRWRDLPQATIETVSPLMDSKYMVQVGKLTEKELPIYLHTQSYREWLQGWTNQLIVGISGENARAVFSVFRIAIRDQDVTIARHILPHLVLHTLVYGSEEDKDGIRLEFNAVLTDQVDPRTGYDPERRLLTAQTIFGLMDHLGVWLRRKTQDISKTSKRARNPAAEEALMCVESLTASISQELMAQASLQCKAYARSLLNFEQRIRSLKADVGRQDSELQPYYENLHQIYAYLDEPDGMEGISTKVISPSLEHQIREHESTGRWTSAQSCWEVELQQRPDDAALHVGLLRCLRNLGHYDTMRTHIRGALSVHPEWEPMLGPYQLEGACILGDWDLVERGLNSRASADSPEAWLARSLLSMREPESIEFNQTVEGSFQALGNPIVAAGQGAYSSVYDVVVQLHMLHELKMVRKALFQPPASLEQETARLNRTLNARLNSTLPSSRTREPLLSLRRTAFAALSSTPGMRPEIGDAWISTAKIARRAGHRQTAYSAMLQATQCQAAFAFVQRVKLLALDEQSHRAIQELNNSLHTLEATFRSGQLGSTNRTGPIVIDITGDSGPRTIDRSVYAKACLLRARLLEATSRFQPIEILERYKEATKEDTNSEKMWYCLGHFQDTHTILPSLAMQRYNVCRALLKSAQLGTKFFYRSVPRVLTIWMDMGGDPVIIGALKSKTAEAKLGPEDQQNLQAFRLLNTLMAKSSKRLLPFQWLAVFPQLVARIVHKNDEAWTVLQDIIITALFAYPQQAMWSMVAGSHSKDSGRKKRFNEIVTRLNSRVTTSSMKEVARTVNSSQKMAKELLRLCDFDVRGEATNLSTERQFPGLFDISVTSDLLLPLQSSMTVNLPANNLVSLEHRPFASNLPMIAGIDDNIEIMNSLQKPRKLVFKGSDGKRYSFLCKPKDDLRKDARLMEFDSMINKLLQSHPESRKRNLYVRTYAVLILNEEHGLIEWVPHTVGFRHILQKQYQARGIPIYTHEVRKDMDQARLSKDPKVTEHVFKESVLKKFPPVFHEWFLATFPEPSAWLKARSSYARTAAVMSMVGFVLGLGDRHGENILFDANSGDTVHVDLNCLFDKGQKFEIPERVPFRLTHNMVDAFGVTGCDGMFRKSAEVTMAILRDNRDSLTSVLEAMVHDPLGEWGAPEERGRKSSSKPDPRIAEARRALDPIGHKLDGRIYRTGEREPTLPYSTNNLVDSLIKEATSPVNLAKMYVGWSSWL